MPLAFLGLPWLFLLFFRKPITCCQSAYAALQLFLDKKGNRQTVVLQPSTGRASAAEAYAFQHSLALTRIVARQQARRLPRPTPTPQVVTRPCLIKHSLTWRQDALVAKEKQINALEIELRKVEAQLARDAEDRTKKDEKLIASVRLRELRFSALCRH